MSVIGHHLRQLRPIYRPFASECDSDQMAWGRIKFQRPKLNFGGFAGLIHACVFPVLGRLLLACFLVPRDLVRMKSASRRDAGAKQRASERGLSGATAAMVTAAGLHNNALFGYTRTLWGVTLHLGGRHS